MTRDRIMKIIDIVLPVVGIGLMIYYGVCDTGCSSLQGTFLGLDLKWIGILYMAALLILALPPLSGFGSLALFLRTLMLPGALGGEILLLRFQVVHDTYCRFCLAFGLCIIVLFVVHFPKMNKWLALGAFLAGLAAFALFFEGTVLPLYT